MSSRIRAAVFPVAGLGSRFLPASKASPKEMFPIVDKPLVQYAVEEAVAAGAEKLVFVTSSSKGAIEDHFENHPELENVLRKSGKEELLALVRDIVPPQVSCTYIQQVQPLGLGHAVLCARPEIGDESFYVHLVDDLILSERPCLDQMREHYERHEASVLAVETVPRDQTANYGIVATHEAAPGVKTVTKIVEKPKPEDAPSKLAVVGRYVLTPKIFDKLVSTGSGADNEIQLTDGIASLLTEEPVHALPFEGQRYDCGKKLGYLEAAVEYGLRHPEIGRAFAAYLAALPTDS